MRSSQSREIPEEEGSMWKEQQVQRHPGHAGRSEKGLCVWKAVREEKGGVGRRLEKCTRT